MTLESRILSDAREAAVWREQWDALAVLARRPMCAPAWMLAWWEHAAPDGAQLRLVAVAEGEDLIGLAPLYIEPGALRRLRFLAAPVSARTEPVAVAGREADVARAIVDAVRSDGAGALLLEGTDERSPWPDAFRSALGGKPPRVERSGQAPRIELPQTDLETWIGGLSQNLRSRMRRHRRRLAESGAVFSRAQTADELERALRAFAVLHGRRWAERGGSAVLDRGVERMLEQAGRELLGQARFRAHTIELEDEVIAVQLFVVAGGECSFWLGGFDERHGNRSPALIALLDAVGECLERGEQSMDLGYGDQDYKLRMANAGDELRWYSVAMPGWRSSLVAGAAAAGRVREAAAARVPSEFKQRLKALRPQRAASE